MPQDNFSASKKHGTSLGGCSLPGSPYLTRQS